MKHPEFEAAFVTENEVIAASPYYAVAINKELFPDLESGKSYNSEGEIVETHKAHTNYESAFYTNEQLGNRFKEVEQRVNVKDVMRALELNKFIYGKMKGQGRVENRADIASTDIAVKIGENFVILNAKRLYDVMETLYNVGEESVVFTFGDKSNPHRRAGIYGTKAKAVIMPIVDERRDLHISKELFTIDLGFDMNAKISKVNNPNEVDKPTEMLSQVVEKRNKC